MGQAITYITTLQQEAIGTRKILARVPESQLGWKPHEKSMSLGRLAMHIAELPRWIVRSLLSTEFDFSKETLQRTTPESQSHILQVFEDNLANAINALHATSDEALSDRWTIRKGPHIIFEFPRKVNIRWTIHHIIHHRGQLSVYLRLLNVPLPNLYGPTADEN
ncbi:MAG: DinB family protein [Filimonas sp.]|nr:DinB family protein [Filimonas sp.]